MKPTNRSRNLQAFPAGESVQFSHPALGAPGGPLLYPGCPKPLIFPQTSICAFHNT
jgi:hypothetical protein